MTATLEEALVYTAEAMGGSLSAAAIEIMVADLAEHPLDDILTALRRCRAERSGRLALAHILASLPGRPPSADEAWERALAARLWDDDATVAVPNAILRAFPFAMWRQGDKVGARRAFIDAYRREAARPDAFDVCVSDGFDRAGRAAATSEAIAAGLLPETAGDGLLPGPGEEPPMPRETGERRFGALLAELRKAGERDRAAAYRRIRTRRLERRRQRGAP